MKFFIPFEDDPARAEITYAAIVAFAGTTLGATCTRRRILKIQFEHNGKRGEAEVGQQFAALREPVIAILESATFLVCTPTRGVIRGEPVLVGRREILSVVDFDQPASASVRS